MSFCLPDTPEALALVRRYVVWGADGSGVRRYMRLLGMNPLREGRPDQDVFNAALVQDAQQISDADLDALLGLEWRARLTAAWLIGLDRRTRYRRRLGELLLESELVHAGQGYCFALARFGTERDAGILTAYLDRYLPRIECRYDQPWAMGALLYLDDQLGTDRAERLLEPGGLWHRSGFSELDPFEWQDRMAELCNFADGLCARGS